MVFGTLHTKRYAKGSNDFHKTIITDRNVFLAAPNTFDDPLDSKFPVRWDLITDFPDVVNHHSCYCASKQTFDHYQSTNTDRTFQGYLLKRPKDLRLICFVQCVQQLE